MFRLAQAMGLFPVSGLGGKNKKNKNNNQVEFRPVSFRLLASVFCIFVLLTVEGNTVDSG